MGIRGYFKGARRARMSDGTHCIVRDLGLVPGGKGMKQHEMLLMLSARGLASKLVEFVGHFAKGLDDDGVRKIAERGIAAPFERDRTGVGGVAGHGARPG